MDNFATGLHISARSGGKTELAVYLAELEPDIFFHKFVYVWSQWQNLCRDGSCSVDRISGSLVIPIK